MYIIAHLLQRQQQQQQRGREKTPAGEQPSEPSLSRAGTRLEKNARAHLSSRTVRAALSPAGARADPSYSSSTVV